MSANKIVFFGNERLATGVKTTAPTLQALISAGYQIVGLVIAQSEIGQSREAREPEIVQIAKDHQIPIFQPSKLRDIHDQLSTLQADIGVLVAFGKMVPQSIIDLFPRGIVNIHPSLLPKHRGPTPLESALLHGDQQTGVSLMQLSSAMDAGPVYAQTSTVLYGHETKQALADLLINIGKDMLITNLPAILDGSLQPVAQDETQAEYDTLIVKTASQLDFNQPAEILERQVRAYTGWPRSRTIVNGIEVIITAAHTIDGVNVPGNLWVGTKQFGFYTSKGILVIDRLIPAGKKDMDVVSFMAGYKIK